LTYKNPNQAEILPANSNVDQKLHQQKERKKSNIDFSSKRISLEKGEMGEEISLFISNRIEYVGVLKFEDPINTPTLIFMLHQQDSAKQPTELRLPWAPLKKTPSSSRVNL
jgi:hypothetical protein